MGDKVFDEYWLNIKGNRIETFGEDGDGYFQMNYWGWGDDWGATHAPVPGGNERDFAE